MVHDVNNTMFSMAADFVNYSSRPVFLTGKAGTGKTTFLKYIKENTNKQTAVVAPTGVAAINAGGVTIHSFFQLPFTPYIPASQGFAGNDDMMDKHHLMGRIKVNRERREVFQKLELLIIDEISMVRCDVIDAIDIILRSFRNRHNEPFGGVQVLYIGDMFQLPPVVNETEWSILSRYYNSPFFFDSKIVKDQPPVHIELNKIYRQNEKKFIDILNKVRNNEMDFEAFETLNDRYDPEFMIPKNDSYIVLTTHNVKADAINVGELQNLKGESITYKAEITGDFNDKTFPADAMLQLKIGAQVMFVKNDGEKRFFNGKIGEVTRLEESTVYVKCSDVTGEIEVRPEKWNNIRYSLNGEAVEEDIIGSYKQLPLRHAWAITIHKSQGLTFEKAVIDAGSSFASGQVYVALSRCTTLNGIVLKSKLTPYNMRNDDRIVQFDQQKHNLDTLTQQLERSKSDYQKDTILKLFDFGSLLYQTGRVIKVFNDHTNSFNDGTKEWLTSLQNAVEQQQTVARKFELQLMVLLEKEALPEENEAAQSRIRSAVAHFVKEWEAVYQTIPQSPAITDSKMVALAYNNELRALFHAISLRLTLLKSCADGFNTEAYNTAKKNFSANNISLNAYAGASEKKTEHAHPDLYRQLRQLRDTICADLEVPIYMVCGSAALDEMSTYLPSTAAQLVQITGFGKVKVHQFGERFLRIINRYAEEYGLASSIGEKKVKKQRKEKEKQETDEPVKAPKQDTKKETFVLYQQGKTLAEIAEQRHLSKQTIEGHLAHFVQEGMISVDELVTREKLVLIEPALEEYDGKSLAPIKTKLGDDVSYGEIRLALAWKEFLKKDSEVTE